MLNIHATLVCYQNKGILIRGVSGAGKSDLALRLIMQNNAQLVADDRVNIEEKGGSLFGSVPDEIKGKIEVRGIGIAEIPYIPSCLISLIVDLIEKKDIERLPEEETDYLCGVKIPKIKLFPFECSASCKIIAKICGFIR